MNGEALIFAKSLFRFSDRPNDGTCRYIGRVEIEVCTRELDSESWKWIPKEVEIALWLDDEGEKIAEFKMPYSDYLERAKEFLQEEAV